MAAKKFRLYFFFPFGVVLLTTCITPFSLKTADAENEDASLVIEGDIILNGETRVYLSHLATIRSYMTIKYVSDAKVWVESKSGEKYPGQAMVGTDKKPCFLIDTRALSLNGQYKLCVILANGRVYESDFLTPLPTPEIGSIEYTVNDSKTAVQFLVTSHGDSNSSRYYKWNYTEDWEVVSTYTPNAYFNRAQNTVFPYLSDPLIKYCWNQSRSSSILVARTDHLAENTVYQAVLNTLYNRDMRISYLYSMELLQMSISKEAYNYWSTLKRNTDDIGSLFAPQPNDIYGNIRCISDKGVRTIGYISAGTRAVKRIFVEGQDIGIYLRPNCDFFDWEKAGSPPPSYRDLYDTGFRIVNSNGRLWAPAICVDCTTIGTKNKPFFWPNDHQ